MVKFWDLRSFMDTTQKLVVGEEHWLANHDAPCTPDLPAETARQVVSGRRPGAGCTSAPATDQVLHAPEIRPLQQEGQCTAWECRLWLHASCSSALRGW